MTVGDQGDILSERFDVFPDEALLELEQAEDREASGTPAQ